MSLTGSGEAEVEVLKHPCGYSHFAFSQVLLSSKWLHKHKPPPTCVHSASRTCGPALPTTSQRPAAVSAGPAAGPRRRPAGTRDERDSSPAALLISASLQLHPLRTFPFPNTPTPDL